MSAETKWAKGPWEVSPVSLADKYINIWESGCVVDYDDVDHAEALANAHLMAASPDLYKALEELLKARFDVHGGLGTRG